MSDIFVSYSSSDKERVRPIVELLEKQGWSVWWDRKIPLGKTFDQVIEEAIDVAKCVLVVWSVESVKSNWIKTEADEGARRGILIPVLIDEVKIPLGFRRIQAAKLTLSPAALSDSEIRNLLNSISALIEKTSGGRPKKRDGYKPEDTATGKKLIKLISRKSKRNYNNQVPWIVGGILSVYIIIATHYIYLSPYFLFINLISILLVTLIVLIKWPVKALYAVVGILSLHALNFIMLIFWRPFARFEGSIGIGVQELIIFFLFAVGNAAIARKICQSHLRLQESKIDAVVPNNS